MYKETIKLDATTGYDFFKLGWQLVRRRGIKRYVVMPLLLNILFMGGSFYWLYGQLGVLIPYLMDFLPNWLQWLSSLLKIVVVTFILITFSYFFSTITNIIAAPFCGLLSEQLEGSLTGKEMPDMGFISLIKDTPRILMREVRKMAYYLPRAIVLLLLYLIPGIGQTIAPLLWLLFGAWMLCIQYCDYPFDNHKIDFTRMKSALSQNKMDNLQFGLLVSVCSMIPIINCIIVPVAVCGATAMWVEQYRPQFINDKQGD